MKPRTSLAAAALALLALGAPAARADEPVRPVESDPGVFPVSGARPALFFTGLAVTAAWYGAALPFAYAWPHAPGADELKIPVAGPWMALAKTGCAEDDPGCSDFEVVLRAILTTIDAVGQAGGVLVMLEAPFVPVSDAPRARKPRRRPGAGVEWRVAPRVGAGVGLGVVGSF
ncbi:MAG: hypothetical protein IT376_08920 [Polyangiaceae bacterium]|nr:hypothetical protein [Polyangiaceae bacterium]